LCPVQSCIGHIGIQTHIRILTCPIYTEVWTQA